MHTGLFVTGHAKPGDVEVDWKELAHTAHHSKLTLVIYMGLSDSVRIQSELLEGLPAEIPLAIVQNATLHDQRHAVSTLGNMRQVIALEKLRSLAVIGDVVSGICAANQIDIKAAREA